MVIAMLFLSWSFGQNDINLDKQRSRDVSNDIIRKIMQRPFSQGQIPHHPLTETSRDPEDLIGEWLSEYFMNSIYVTSGTDQTVPSFMQRMGMEPASGSINISGAFSGHMNYMYLMASDYYDDAFFVMLGNNPVNPDGGYYGDPYDMDLPYFQFTYISDPGDYEICMFMAMDTLDGDTVGGYWYSSEGVSDHITVDSTLMVTIDDLNLYDSDSNTVLISGSLVPESIEIEAGVPTVFSFSEPDYEDEGRVWEFFDDGTGLQLDEWYDDYYEESMTDSLQFDWYANDDSVSIISYDEYYYDESILDTMTSAYSVMDDTLYLWVSENPCMDDYYYYDDCDEYYDNLSMTLLIDDIQWVLFEESLVMSSMVSLSIDKDHVLPLSVKLYQNHPNPFNPVTNLLYNLPEDVMVNITIYDMMGRQVKTLINGLQTAGYKTIQWDATNDKNHPVSAGLYLYTIQAGEYRQTKKMILLK